MENGTLSERYFNTTSSLQHNAYQYSKTLAEKEAWKIAESQTRWDLVVLCPGLVLGPSLTPSSDSGSLAIIDQLLSGYYMLPGAPDLAWAMVDVRDVAAAHIRAAEVPAAKGRYIISHSSLTSLMDVSTCLKRVHRSPRSLPSWQMPHFLFRLVAPLVGISQAWVSANMGIRFAVDNTRSIKELGMEYRPVEEMLLDHYQAWAAHH